MSRIPKGLAARYNYALALLVRFVDMRPDIGRPGVPGTPSFTYQRARELLASEGVATEGPK